MDLDPSTINLLDHLCKGLEGKNADTTEKSEKIDEHAVDGQDADHIVENLATPDDEEVAENVAIFSRAAADGASSTAGVLLLSSALRGNVNEALELMGFDDFLSPQQEAYVIVVAEGRDVAVNLPTAGGKSLVYQLPIYGELMKVRG